MRRYTLAYAAWFAFVLTAATIALLWYRHVEQIGVRELADRLHDDSRTDDTGFSNGKLEEKL